MPEFSLNTPPRPAHPFYALDTFARGYVEAMFFTNGDCGDENEFVLNELGVERLTKASVAAIKTDCDRFQRLAFDALEAAYNDNVRPYEAEQAGRDLWFTRQGHGVGFQDREISAPVADVLDAAARHFGESYVEHYRGWIHVR